MTLIRPIRAEDAPAFRDVLDQVCRERTYLAQLEAPSLERAQAFVAANVAADHPQFVAEVAGALLGWCDVLPGGPASTAPHIGRLGMGVLKAYRGQGIGRRLIGATIQKTRLQGLEKIELTVHASNAPAIALYRRFGFAAEGIRKRGWFVDGVYDDIMLMALDLRAQSPDSAPTMAHVGGSP